MTTVRAWLTEQKSENNDVYQQQALGLLDAMERSYPLPPGFSEKIVEILQIGNGASTENLFFILKALLEKLEKISTKTEYAITACYTAFINELESDFQKTMAEKTDQQYKTAFENKIDSHDSQLIWLETLSLADFDNTLIKMKQIHFKIDYDGLRHLFWTSHKHQSSKVLKTLLQEQAEAAKKEEKKPEVRSDVREGILGKAHMFSAALKKANAELAQWHHRVIWARLSTDRQRGYVDIQSKLKEAEEKLNDFSRLVKYSDAVHLSDTDWKAKYSNAAGQLEYQSFSEERKREIGYYIIGAQQKPKDTLYDCLVVIAATISARSRFFESFRNDPKQVVLVLQDDELFRNLEPGDLKEILIPWIDSKKDGNAEEKILRALNAQVQKNPGKWVTITIKDEKDKLTANELARRVAEYDHALSLHLPVSENALPEDEKAEQLPSYLAYELQPEDIAAGEENLRTSYSVRIVEPSTKGKPFESKEEQSGFEFYQIPATLMDPKDETFSKDLRDLVMGASQNGRKPIVFAGILRQNEKDYIPYFIHVKPNSHVQIIFATPSASDYEALTQFFTKTVFAENQIEVVRLSVTPSLPSRDSGYNALSILEDAFTKLSMNADGLAFDETQLTVQNAKQSKENRQYWSDILYSQNSETTPEYDYYNNIKNQQRLREDKIDNEAYKLELNKQFVLYLKGKYRFDPDKNQSLMKLELDEFMAGYFKIPVVMHHFERLDADSQKNLVDEVKKYFIHESLVSFHSEKIKSMLNQELILSIFSAEMDNSLSYEDAIISGLKEKDKSLGDSVAFLKDNNSKLLESIILPRISNALKTQGDILIPEFKQKIENASLNQLASLLPENYDPTSSKALDSLFYNGAVYKFLFEKEASFLDSSARYFLRDQVKQMIDARIAVTAQKEIEEGLSQRLKGLSYEYVDRLSKTEDELKGTDQQRLFVLEDVKRAKCGEFVKFPHVVNMLNQYPAELAHGKIRPACTDLLSSINPLIEKMSDRFDNCSLFLDRYDEIRKKFNALESRSDRVSALRSLMHDLKGKLAFLKTYCLIGNTEALIKEIEVKLNLFTEDCMKMAVNDLKSSQKRGMDSFVPALRLMLYQALDVPDLGVKGPLFRRSEVEQIKASITAEYAKCTKTNAADYTFFKGMKEADQYDVLLMSAISCRTQIDVQSCLSAELKQQAETNKTPILVRGENDFFLYGCSAGQRWSVTQLDTNSLPNRQNRRAIKDLNPLFNLAEDRQVVTLKRNNVLFNQHVVAALKQGHQPKTKHDIRMPCKIETATREFKEEKPEITPQWLTQFVADWQKTCVDSQTEEPVILKHLIYAVNNIPREIKDDDRLTEVKVSMLVPVTTPIDPASCVHFMSPLAENEKPLPSTNDFLYAYQGPDNTLVYYIEDRGEIIKCDPIKDIHLPEGTAFTSTRGKLTPFTGDNNVVKSILEITSARKHTSKWKTQNEEVTFSWCDLYIKRMLNDISTYGAMIKNGTIVETDMTAKFINCLRGCKGLTAAQEQTQGEDKNGYPILMGGTPIIVRTIGDVETIINQYKQSISLTVTKVRDAYKSKGTFFSNFNDMHRLELALKIIKQRRGDDLTILLNSDDIELLSSVSEYQPHDISLIKDHPAVKAFKDLKQLCTIGKYCLKPELSLVRNAARIVTDNEREKPVIRPTKALGR